MGNTEDKFVIKHVNPGKLNALVFNLMESMGTNNPDEAVRNINSRKWIPKPSDRGWWIEDDETTIRGKFRKYSHMRPSEWGRTFRQGLVDISEEVREILFHRDDIDFATECDEIVIIPGSDWGNDDRTMNNIILMGTEQRNFVQLKPEDACILRSWLTPDDFKKMGLTSIVTIHKPIDGHKLLVSENPDGRERFRTTSVPNTHIWPESYGFAFGVRE